MFFRFLTRTKTFPWILLLICLAAYALFIPWLGFYWDDFPMNWIASTMGGEGLARYFATNRPFWGLIYRLTTPLLGSSPLPWHLFALALRWGTGLGFWWLARLTWPRQKVFAAWAALLFVVYPGFSQQGGAFLYSHFFIVLNLFLLSLCFTLLALRQPRRFWLFSGLAWIASAVNLFSMEYFFLLEFLRPVLIWMVLGDEDQAQPLAGRARVWRTLRLWLPYLAIFLGAGAWRSLALGFQTYQPAFMSRLKTQPLQALWGLVQVVLKDVWLSTGGAWLRAFRPPSTAEVGERNLQRYWLLVVAAAGASLVYLLGQSSSAGGARQGRGRAWLWQPLLLGGLGLFIAGGPFWLTDLELVLSFSHDRFSLPFMLGASLVIPALLMLIPAPDWAKVIPLAVALGFATGMQFQQGIIYRRDWSVLNAFFWQMNWRIPDMQPGTVLLANELPVIHYTDNSLSAPLNWIYDPEGDSTEVDQDGDKRMNYILYYPTLRSASESWMANLQKGLPLQRDYLAAKFHGSSSQVVVMFFNPPGCLRVLQPDLEQENWMLSEALRAVLPLSEPQVILGSPLPDQQVPHLPEQIFDSEPAHGWCYYFEKADLARQVGDWEEVVRLSEAGLNSGDYPNDPVERLPLVEGYAHVGNWQGALQTSRDTGAVTPLMKPILCRLWERIERETPESAERQAALGAVRTENGCGQAEP